MWYENRTFSVSRSFTQVFPFFLFLPAMEKCILPAIQFSWNAACNTYNYQNAQHVSLRRICTSLSVSLVPSWWARSTCCNQSKIRCTRCAMHLKTREKGGGYVVCICGRHRHTATATCFKSSFSTIVRWYCNRQCNSCARITNQSTNVDCSDFSAAAFCSLSFYLFNFFAIAIRAAISVLYHFILLILECQKMPLTYVSWCKTYVKQSNQIGIRIVFNRLSIWSLLSTSGVISTIDTVKNVAILYSHDFLHFVPVHFICQ